MSGRKPNVASVRGWVEEVSEGRDVWREAITILIGELARMTPGAARSSWRGIAHAVVGMAESPG